MVSVVELPGLVDVSREAHAAGLAPGMREWRCTFPFGVVVVIRDDSVECVLARCGEGVLMVEDLAAAEVV